MAIEDYEGDMKMCCRCSACKYIPLQMIRHSKFSDVCPSIARYNFHAYSGGGKLLIGREMLAKGFEYTDRFLHIVFNCLLCGACDVSCKYAMDMEVLLPISELRMKCVENGNTHPTFEKVINLLRSKGKMVEGEGKRSEWAEGLNIKDVRREKVEVYYHAGCLSSYNKEYHHIPRTVAKMLKEAGVNFGIAYEGEICCGGRAHEMGYREDFFNQAMKNVEIVKRSGARVIVTSCAHCYHAFKVLYDRYGFKEFEVLHITELLEKLIKEGRIKIRNSLALNVTYHDPCYLGRLGEAWIHFKGKKLPGIKFVFDPPKTYRRGAHGVYNPPREVLRMIPGLKIYEMERKKEYAWCCGAGGGVSESNPDFALWTAERRLEEAMETGATVIVTACPWCEQMLKKAVASRGVDLQVWDVVEVVERTI
uniref:(Fe-S)-binding protein n=1 Tax=candidate division WOR-3 bacterium TaxID=2052148 RepID=A0A7C2K0Z5_UNCW3